MNELLRQRGLPGTCGVNLGVRSCLPDKNDKVDIRFSQGTIKMTAHQTAVSASQLEIDRQLAQHMTKHTRKFTETICCMRTDRMSRSETWWEWRQLLRSQFLSTRQSSFCEGERRQDRENTWRRKEPRNRGSRECSYDDPGSSISKRPRRGHLSEGRFCWRDSMISILDMDQNMEGFQVLQVVAFR